MLKKIIVVIALVIIVGVLVFGAVNRTLARVNPESNSMNQQEYGSTNTQSQFHDNQAEGTTVQSRGNGNGNLSELTNLPPASIGELSESEAAGLLYMREEEKLAYDIYATLYSQYGNQNFQNISQSELAHSEAVKTLIDRYGLVDPAISEIGVFSNPDLQTLYDALISRGSLSITEAYTVGGTIEEIDILDLQQRLTQTDNADIQQVYQNLLNGSKNHLRAFVAKLQRENGEAYVPQYLDLDVYQSIVNTDTQTGGNNQGIGGINQNSDNGNQGTGGGFQGPGGGSGGYRGGNQ